MIHFCSGLKQFMAPGNCISNRIAIEIAYAEAKQQWLIPAQVAPGTTIRQAIESCGILQQCLTINLAKNKVGIFGKIMPLETQVQAGDRIEIYRPLAIEPKMARRLRTGQSNPKTVHIVPAS